jgi:hypothetical protein
MIAFGVRYCIADAFLLLSATIMKSSLRSARQALLAAAVAFLFLPAGAQSQTSDMPPKLEKVDEIESPAAPAASAEASPVVPKGRQIIEKRERGQFTSIEVRSGERSYYIDPGEEPGTVVPGDAQSGTTRTPQWKIFEFDLKRPVDPNQAAPNPASAAPPAPVK